MKKNSAAVLSAIFVVMIVVPSLRVSSAVILEDCSCTAPDQSCSASASCPHGGCILQCVGQGDCLAECSGFYQMFAMDTTLQLQNARYPQLISELARISGRDIAFSPTKPDSVLNADYKKAVLWDVLDMLSDRGTVQIGGKDFEKLKRIRKALLSGTKISLCIGNTPVSTFVNDMSSLSGVPLRITSGKPMTLVNLKLQEVTFDEILVKVSEQTGTKIIEDPSGGQ